MTESLPESPHVDDLAFYQSVVARTVQLDSTMWQVPSMSLTGQAFLMTIALAPDSSRAARTMAAILIVVVSALSMQLLARLRRLNVICSNWLAPYEDNRFHDTL